MSLEFITFVETLGDDGYWHETSKDTGFLAGYCSDYDGYITDELFIGLSNIRDGYFSKMFKRKPLTDLSMTVTYKLDMLSCLGNNSMYYLMLSEINQFDWNREIYASHLTVSTTFYDVAPDFLLYYVTALNSLGPPDKVRLIIFKKG
jgi:hypothetical protein